LAGASVFGFRRCTGSRVFRAWFEDMKYNASQK
jgi:hypothetical protein